MTQLAPPSSVYLMTPVLVAASPPASQPCSASEKSTDHRSVLELPRTPLQRRPPSVLWSRVPPAAGDPHVRGVQRVGGQQVLHRPALLPGPAAAAVRGLEDQAAVVPLTANGPAAARVQERERAHRVRVPPARAPHGPVPAAVRGPRDDRPGRGVVVAGRPSVVRIGEGDVGQPVARAIQFRIGGRGRPGAAAGVEVPQEAVPADLPREGDLRTVGGAVPRPVVPRPPPQRHALEGARVGAVGERHDRPPGVARDGSGQGLQPLVGDGGIDGQMRGDVGEVDVP